MDALKALYERASVREYKDEPISKDKLEQVIEAGRQAPTAKLEEPWEFVIVTDKNKIKELANITDYGKFMANAAAAIAVFCRDIKYYLEDGCAATENILVAATALGIGSCWVAGDKKSYAGKIAVALSVPEGLKLVSIISLGYPKEPPKKSRIRSLKEVAHWEKF